MGEIRRYVKGFLSGTGKVYWVVLQRPEKLNALTKEAWLQLAAELGKGCASTARLVALRGEGRAFCTGDDIKAMYDFAGEDDAREFFESLRRAVDALASCRVPVAAVVHGYAYGGCAEILLLIDYVVGVKGAKIAAPEVSLGLIPPMLSPIGSFLLGRRARWMALSGEPIDVDEARNIGLVDVVVESVEDAVRHVEEKASILDGVDANAVAVTRRILFAPLLGFIEKSGSFEELVKLSLTPQAKARMEAFLKRRKCS
ncbi:enoyl-CoA hydratase/isomerase family protein [Stetteria hydrogenophila]